MADEVEKKLITDASSTSGVGRLPAIFLRYMAKKVMPGTSPVPGIPSLRVI
ncbi:hypothetical protein [Streptomyces sp. CL12]|uniref:hypothetical protein n=1 Tax=Streptomyces sp. CL12 TaxID=3391744 RepID=UPI003A7FCED0